MFGSSATQAASCARGGQVGLHDRATATGHLTPTRHIIVGSIGGKHRRSRERMHLEHTYRSWSCRSRERLQWNSLPTAGRLQNCSSPYAERLQLRGRRVGCECHLQVMIWQASRALLPHLVLHLRRVQRQQLLRLHAADPAPGVQAVLGRRVRAEVIAGYIAGLIAPHLLHAWFGA